MTGHVDIRVATSADGKHVMLTMPYATGAAEILRSVGARWRKSQRAWAIPLARQGDVECRLNDLRALADVTGGHNEKSPTPENIEVPGFKGLSCQLCEHVVSHGVDQAADRK
jgi:hypothetical protein